MRICLRGRQIVYSTIIGISIFLRKIPNSDVFIQKLHNAHSRYDIYTVNIVQYSIQYNNLISLAKYVCENEINLSYGGQFHGILEDVGSPEISLQALWHLCHATCNYEGLE